MTSNTENVPMVWDHHDYVKYKVGLNFSFVSFITLFFLRSQVNLFDYTLYATYIKSIFKQFFWNVITFRHISYLDNN